MKRRQFLSLAGAAAAELLTHRGATALAIAPSTPKHASANQSLRIQEINLELAPGANVKTIAYNGQVPGPLLRLKEGVPVTIDVFNETSAPELVHWHGMHI